MTDGMMRGRNAGGSKTKKKAQSCEKPSLMADAHTFPYWNLPDRCASVFRVDGGENCFAVFADD